MRILSDVIYTVILTVVVRESLRILEFFPKIAILCHVFWSKDLDSLTVL